MAKKAAKKLAVKKTVLEIGANEPTAKKNRARRAPRKAKNEAVTLAEHSYLLVPHGEEFNKVHEADAAAFRAMIETIKNS